MGGSNNLTDKKYWSDSWKEIRLPARFFYHDFSHSVVDSLISKFMSGTEKNFLEIGGCPGRWADYFDTKHKMSCDSMDYDENNVKIIKKNYELLGIRGDVFCGDITDSSFSSGKQYDVVLSDGLLEHFADSREVFRNHVKFLKQGGLLIIGVPNIKESWFYDFFSKHDRKSYIGYRNVDVWELNELSLENDLSVLFCGYVGVFNIGLINMNSYNLSIKIIMLVAHVCLSGLLNIFGIRKESKTFSPYIYLIARK